MVGSFGVPRGSDAYATVLASLAAAPRRCRVRAPPPSNAIVWAGWSGWPVRGMGIPIRPGCSPRPPPWTRCCGPRAPTTVRSHGAQEQTIPDLASMFAAQNGGIDDEDWKIARLGATDFRTWCREVLVPAHRAL